LPSKVVGSIVVLTVLSACGHPRGTVGLRPYDAPEHQSSTGTLTAEGGRGRRVLNDADLKPGDFIFYGDSGALSHHVVIYAGNGLVVQAHQSGVPIEVSPMEHVEDHFGVHVNN
jgi:cell wall-associated NlpC family hydrolase